MFGIVTQTIDLAALRDLACSEKCGAVVTFEGVVRDHDEGESVLAITYEAYAEMAEKEGAAILDEAKSQWPEVDFAAVHRTGRLEVGEVSIAIVAASPHRREAFVAAQYVIDSLKERLPVWKKQETPGGSKWKSGP